MAVANNDGAMEIDPAMEGEDREAIEAKNINEEYKIWRKNAPYLYDRFYSSALKWPTLTAQWFPDKKKVDEDSYATHRILFGTHTGGEEHSNYVQVAECKIPISLTPDVADYNPETEEIGGHGVVKKNVPQTKFNITQKIPHNGEVNKARYQPQNPDLLATMTNTGDVCIFDRTKHPSVPAPNAEVKPEILLSGHTSEGFALNWNAKVEGQLATGANDSTVKVWDITSYDKSTNRTAAPRTFTHHAAVVNDLEFHPACEWMLATVSDDLSLQILDLRKDSNTKAEKSVPNAHNDAISSVAFNPASEYILATGSADHSIALWDLRMLQVKLHALEGHKSGVERIEWNPIHKQVLASGSADRRVIFWDLSAVGKEQTPEDAEDGPPELMFMHGGHTNRISDLSFSRHDPFLMCSAADDNLLHVWRPHAACLGGSLDDDDVTLEELEA